MSTEQTAGVEQSFFFESPVVDDGRDLLMVVADGETPEEAEARAQHIAVVDMNYAGVRLVHRTGAPPADFDGPRIDVRGRTWFKDDRIHWGTLLPSYWQLLERVNFRYQGFGSQYLPVGISQEESLWLVHRAGGRWPEWLVYPIDARSFSPREAITIIPGDADHLRCALLEMGCSLSPHEKEQLRLIRNRLTR
ncbi:hypothetical protein ACFVGM_09260 [Kitasatospora purpeofusca]|uniref:hypothetical protein n=1 Tax=Kitasatospora purpeofusca TaxID=67352 RepID=UPI0036A0EF68